MSLEIHLKAVIECVWRCTWRVCWSTFGDALGGRDRARLEKYSEASKLEVVVRERGATGAETLFIG
jgi:hypothetical protein